jgi:hypothetical protein
MRTPIGVSLAGDASKKVLPERWRVEIQSLAAKQGCNLSRRLQHRCRKLSHDLAPESCGGYRVVNRVRQDATIAFDRTQ